MRKKKLSVVPMDGDYGTIRSKSAKRGNGLNPCTRLEEAPKLIFTFLKYVMIICNV